MTTNESVTPARRRHFADGSAIRLALPDGEWVLVRKELSYGQQRRLAAAAVTSIDPAAMEQGEVPRVPIDLAAFEIERLVLWLLDWSLTDVDGEAVHVSREAIENLTPATAADVNAALDRHVEALEGKGAPAPVGRNGSAASSSSVRPSAGAGRP